MRNQYTETKALFRGNRNYLHGADIADTIVGFSLDLGASSLELSVNKMTDKNVKYIPAENLLPDDVKIGYGQWELNSSVINKFVIVENDRKIAGADQYDENIITNLATISRDGACIDSTLVDYSYLEIIIAIKKAYLRKKYANHDIKWIFAKLNMSKLKSLKDENNESVEIQFKKALGVKLVISNVIIGGNNVGQIAFSSIEEKNL